MKGLRYGVDYCHRCDVDVDRAIVEGSDFTEDVAGSHAKGAEWMHKGYLEGFVSTFQKVRIYSRCLR